MPRLTALLNKFLARISSVLSSRNHGARLKNPLSGYVLILVIMTIPVLLFGAKYILDLSTLHEVQLEEEKTKGWYKRCAKEAALAVAKNWNPGLTLARQKEAVQKVADQVYNDNPCYNDSIVGQAVAGLDVKQSHNVEQGGSKYQPIKVNYDLIVPEKKVKYVSKNQYKVRKYSYPYSKGTYALWRSIDVNSNAGYRHSVYDEIDTEELAKGNYVLNHHKIYDMPSMGYNGHICKMTDGVYYPNATSYAPECHFNHRKFIYSVLSDTNDNEITYYPVHNTLGHTHGNYGSTKQSHLERVDPAEGDTDAPIVKVSIENDKIKVQTDNDIAYAEPAKCNVDIVLAVPVNGAANNQYNQDTSSVIAENTTGTPEEEQGLRRKEKHSTLFQIILKAPLFIR